MKLCHRIGLQCSAGIAECIPIGAAIPSPTQGIIDPVLSCWCSIWLFLFVFLLLVLASCTSNWHTGDLARMPYNWGIYW